jgi:hypothetical protein
MAAGSVMTDISDDCSVDAALRMGCGGVGCRAGVGNARRMLHRATNRTGEHRDVGGWFVIADMVIASDSR